MLVGDVHPEVADVAGALTPVPGGVGPLTIAMLMKNTLTAARGAEVADRSPSGPRPSDPSLAIARRNSASVAIDAAERAMDASDEASPTSLSPRGRGAA